MTAGELTWLSLHELTRALRCGRVSAREALNVHLAQIERVNPVVNAVVTLDADGARARARAVDEARAQGRELPVLAGVPMTHKDTHLTAGMRTTFGSPIRQDFVPDVDSPIIAGLRAAGVVATGKTNVPEFAAGAHTFNPVFGTTRNPFDHSRSAAGSSGGAAAAIACGVQAAGDGSDTGGSLRLPASFNNIVGLRPSAGWIPHSAPENPFEWLTQSGFMARTVCDIALLMRTVAQPAPSSAPRHRVDEFDHPCFDPASGWEPDLAGVRIGFAPTLGGRLEVEAQVLSAVQDAAEVFAGLGGLLDESVPRLDDAPEVFRTARAYEFGINYGHLLAEHSGQMKPALRANIEAGTDLSITQVFAAEKARGRLLEDCRSYFRDHDVLVTVTSQVLPFDADQEFPVQINGRPMQDYMSWLDSTTLFSAAGLPAVSVPAGFSSEGLPIGLQIVGAHGADALVLRVGAAFEAMTGCADRRPDFLS